MKAAVCILVGAGRRWAAAAAAVETTKDNIYALCTVRDVTVKDDQMVGTIYRSAVFSAPASYDKRHLADPGEGRQGQPDVRGCIAKSKGLSKDRMSLGKGDEHYCIEAPLTLEGKDKLEAMTRDWDQRQISRGRHGRDRLVAADGANGTFASTPSWRAMKSLVRQPRRAGALRGRAATDRGSSARRTAPRPRSRSTSSTRNAPPTKPPPPKASASARPIARNISESPAATPTNKETDRRAPG